MSAKNSLLISYIRKNDSELYNVLERLCMEFSLYAGKRTTGITFLRPVDENVREKIFKLAYSDDIEEVYQATNLLNAMIITDYIPSHRKFHECKDSLSNRLKQKVSINTVNIARVEFNDSAYAVIDPNFVDKGKTPKYSVYSLYGELPTNSKESEQKTTRRTRRGRGAKGEQEKEQAEITQRIFSATMELRHNILATTAGEYYEVLCDSYKTAKDFEKLDNPYIVKSLSLLMFIKKKYPDLYPHLLARTNLDKSDLYLYLQSNNQQFLIAPEIINEWSRGNVDLSGITIADACDMVAKDINEILYSSEEQRCHALDTVDEAREKWSNNLIEYNKLKQIYIKLMKTIPESISAKYSVEQKMWEDDFRMTCWVLFDKVEEEAFGEHRNPLYELEETLGKLNASMTGPHESRMRILRGGGYSLKDTGIFINSIYFMYIPVFDIDKDLDLNTTDVVQPHLEDDMILSPYDNAIKDVKNKMGDKILGTNLSANQVLSAMDILLSKKRSGHLTKEEEWKLAELRGDSN